MTDGLKWGFIPHASVTILALSLTIQLLQKNKKAFFLLKLASAVMKLASSVVEIGFICH